MKFSHVLPDFLPIMRTEMMKRIRHVYSRTHYKARPPPPADGQYIHSYHNLSTTATSPQRQRPVKRVLSTNERFIQNPIFFNCKRS